VHILPPLPLEHPCQSNCSAFGATCVILDSDATKISCLCPNGKLLDAFNPKCSDPSYCGVYTKHGFCVGQQNICVGQQKLKLFLFCRPIDFVISGTKFMSSGRILMFRVNSP
jgi:hypothetical protein